MKKAYLYSIFAIMIFSLYACNNKSFEIKNFNPFVNFSNSGDTLNLPMDLSDVIIDGVVLPSKKQSSSGYFTISFEIINRTNSPKAFYYKIFYQNESYKFNEHLDSSGIISYNELSGNNFYGSWENSIDSFHLTPIIPNDNKYHVVTDSFKIQGNPRDEEKYFGAQPKNFNLSDNSIKNAMNSIKNNAEWYNQIKGKAKVNNVPKDEQLFNDALWVVNENNKQGNENNRWKRNPRVGNYSFLITVTSDNNLDKIPETIKNINKKINNKFINPFFTLLYNKELQNNEKIAIVKSKKVLKTLAKFDLGSGIYIDEFKFKTISIDTSYYTKKSGSNFNAFKNSQFEQYFHMIDKNNVFKNVPVAYDIVGDNYSRDEYNNNIAKYFPDKYIADCFQISEIPCKTVSLDSIHNKIIIKNPGNKVEKYRKENVGINSRIGFTYGKFIARIKFPAIINKENVWNGLTCAYWLKYQEDNEWNNRMERDGPGYLSKGIEGPNSPLLKNTYYSEIDFEILKTSNYWPKTSYSDKSKVPHDTPNLNHDIMVTCTNWDLACKMPKNFSVGANDFFNGQKHYTTHRWDHWYKALTIKTAVNHDSIFNRPFYYEIDWQPERIIWRIGDNRNNMIEVGYMDNTITVIPDNQMIIVFTQEFHDSKWWPLSPFLQEMIPYPKNDIIGEILEVQIE